MARMGRGVRGLTAAAGRSPAPGSFQRPCWPSGLVGAGADLQSGCGKEVCAGIHWVLQGSVPEVAAYSQLLSIPIRQGPRDTTSLEVRKPVPFCPSLSGQMRCRCAMADSPVRREPVLSVSLTHQFQPLCVPSAQFMNKTSKLTC